MQRTSVYVCAVVTALVGKDDEETGIRGRARK